MTLSAAIRFASALGVATALGLAVGAQSVPPAHDLSAQVDQVFARWTTATPGCAVGVGVGGRSVLTKAYGMADLEHDVPIGPETIFEAGSVSKQFTAAAVLLLAAEGKLSLEDPARKYLPELPDYGVPLTIRHMLTHTSGLRDWGSVASIAGWPRTSRVHTHAHVLEIVGRQKTLNFPPGSRYSYSNTGYNLAAIIVSRVSGMTFSEFTKNRIFEPLGMTHTSWRDDYTRILRNRATAYAERPDGYHTLMPFENVYGNGGLLTTVGDLLKWNENFVSPKVGDGAQVRRQQQPDRFNDNRPHGYALGLMVDPYKGVRQIAHSGSTAGYSAYLARYPDQHVSVAVLCNVVTNATMHAHAVADLYLGDRLRPETPRPAHTLSTSEMATIAGLYRDNLTGEPSTIVQEANSLRVESGSALVPLSKTRFATTSRHTWDFDSRGGARVTDQHGTVDSYQRMEPARPTVEQLRLLTGRYFSDDADATINVDVEGQSLVLKRRPDTKIALTPLYADTFSGSIGTVIFRRDDSGRPEAFSVVQDRVWDMRFTLTDR